jgi:hypothetical protein
MGHGIALWKLVAAVAALCATVLLAVTLATDPQDNVTLVETALRTSRTGARWVTGTFRNNTDRTYAHVRLDIDLLRADSSVAGRTHASATNLGAGETWSFEAPVIDQQAVRARLVKLTCRRDGDDAANTGVDVKPDCALGREIEVP